MTDFSDEFAALVDAQQEYEEKNPDPWSHAAGPLHQKAAAEKLDMERQRFENGEAIALLGAIRTCANHDLPLPEWTSRAYIRAYDKVLRCESNSWDEVFGKPYPGKHIDKLKQRRELRFAIHNRVNELLMSGYTLRIDENGKRQEVFSRAKDEALFEEVGAEFGIGKTLCNELFYEVQKLMDR